jgi:hypothetical protein
VANRKPVPKPTKRVAPYFDTSQLDEGFKNAMGWVIDRIHRYGLKGSGDLSVQAFCQEVEEKLERGTKNRKEVTHVD